MEKSKQSLAQNVKIRCRVCSKEIYRKNYKSHLKTSHPAANCEDLSPFGQGKLTTFLTPSPVSHPADAGHDQAGLGPSSAGQNILVVDDAGDEVTRKRRHESGESLESGFIDDEEVPSSEKSKKVDDESEVSLKTLDMKMDKILEVLQGKQTEQREGSGSVQVQEDLSEASLKIKHCRTLNGILGSGGFKYDQYSGAVTCQVCDAGSKAGGIFYYSSSDGLEFEEDEYIPRTFSNLKAGLIRHIETSKSHLDAVSDMREKEKAKSILMSKNREAGMNLGRLCMEKYINGRSYYDYETDVLLLAKAGAEVGELNHSRKFPAAFRPFVTQVVHERVEKYLNTPLTQTGHLPPCAVSADKGTYKHRSRQFLCCVVVMPGGNNWLEVLTCGQPVVTQGSTGVELAKNMKQGFDNTGISSEQIESGVFDGVYFHCSIEDHLGKLYKLPSGKVLYSWDALHKTGLVDKHMQNKDSFKWLQELVYQCSQIFNTFNWGANYELFREATVTWKLSLSNLVNFSDTRFANSKRKVFKNIHRQFGPIISCLEDQIDKGRENRSGLEAANTQLRNKADKAAELHGKILSVDFLLTLSGLADIYDKFGMIVQVTQMVHLLPHERLDMYYKAVKQMRSMALCQDHSKCAEFSDRGAKCLWPLNHEDKRTFSEKGKIRDLTVINKQGIRSAGLQVVTRREAGERLVRAGENTVEESDAKLAQVVKELSAGLLKEVYSDEVKGVVEHTRSVLDLVALALKLKVPGTSNIKLAVTEFPKFKEAIEKVPVVSLQSVPVDELKHQYRIFLDRLASMTSKLSVEELAEFDPKELIKNFFDPAGQKYESIEMIMQVKLKKIPKIKLLLHYN